jgi:hypothetical protein
MTAPVIPLDATMGKPSQCALCPAKPTLVLCAQGKQIFLCTNDIGEFVSTWTTASHFELDLL